MTKIKKSRAVLENLHELKERRYAGDLVASDELIDFQSALKMAKLTARQMEVITLVYDLGLKQEIACSIMGVSQQRVSKLIELAEERLDEVYEYWSYLDETEEKYANQH